MNLELVKIINKAKISAVEVAFWIKSKKYVKKLSIETIEAIMSCLLYTSDAADE